VSVTQHESRSASSGALPHGFVPGNEREKILAAVADVVSVVGYEAMTLEDVADHIGVGVDTVRGYFSDKESAFLAAYEAAVWQGMDRVLRAIDTTDGFTARIWAGWGAFIDFIVSEPAFASMCIVDVLATGPAGIERRNMTLRGFAALIEQIADESLPPQRPRPPELYLSIVLGGIAEVVRGYLADGRIAQLPEALPPMHYTLTVPYIGHDAALQEYERRERSTR